MNPTPDAPEQGAPNLRRAVATLPTHEPAPATWPRIATQLAADEALAQLVPALPTHEPADDLWAAIAARLDAPAAAQASDYEELVPAPAQGVVRRLWPARPALRRALALAASLLLLLGGWWLRPAAPGRPPVAAATTSAGPRESVAYSEETAAAPAPASPTAPDPLELQGQAFIQAQCSALPGVCQSGEFRSLRTQLAELETQEARLRLDARRFGTSPELLREQAQLISLKAALTRELVQLFIS